MAACQTPAMTTTVDLGSEFLRAHIDDGGVLRVRIDRVERRNAMTQDMYRGVKRAAVRADTDADVTALCITGTDFCFAAGGDMSRRGLADDTLLHEHDSTDHFPFRHLERCRKPVIAAVNGICHAGGLNLVLYSDVAIATASATFRAPELLRGIADPYISARLADHVGTGTARYLLFTGAVIDAEHARSIGLIGAVFPDDRFAEAVEETIEQVRSVAPRATAAVKADITRALRRPDERIFYGLMMGDEMVEGMKAFMEKRPPVWPR